MNPQIKVTHTYDLIVDPNTGTPTLTHVATAIEFVPGVDQPPAPAAMSRRRTQPNT